ncbi:MAG: NFACT family protein [Oscillospiraceae bacterium]|jgi:predicted ribosome quality control (RQC) complex YloA/Tae2 family protein|nr:NFACT family protein [Oscillospiraceae bacterium]
MSIDVYFLSSLVRELAGTLAGARIDKIQQPERDTLLFSVYCPKAQEAKNRRLLISRGSADARVHFTEAALPSPEAAPMFCMLLRKYILGARILGVEQIPDERIVRLELSASNALGDAENLSLYCEIMGRNSNIILTDREGRVIDACRRADAETSRRPLLPGLFYRLPPKSERARVLQVQKQDEVLALISEAGDRRAEKALPEIFSGVSPLIAREAAFLAAGSTDALCSAAPERLAEELCRIISLSARGEAYIAEVNGKPTEFSFFPIAQYGAGATKYMPSFSETLDAFFTETAGKNRAAQKTSALARHLNTTLERVLRRTAKQEEEQEHAKEREFIRESADILMASLYAVPQGASAVTAEDFYRGGERRIELDPRKTPAQNAEKYYREYTKKKSAAKHLEALVEKGQSEAEYLSSCIAQLRMCETEADIAAIRAELTESGYVKPDKSAGKKGKKKPPAFGAPAKFTAPSGRRVLVGKNNVQNENVTFSLSRKYDLWLHCQGSHGAHVVLEGTPDGEYPPDEDILFAARLAAQFSESRDSDKAQVDYCFCRFVKRHPSRLPGQVLFTDYFTVTV